MNCKSFVPKYGPYKGKEVSSELFANLVDHYKGDTDAANRAYEVAFSSQFIDYFGGDWTTEPTANASVYTEPSIDKVLEFIASQFEEEMLPPLSEETQDELRNTQLASLIIPELGVAKQQTIVDFMAAVISKKVIEAREGQKLTEDDTFGKLEEYFRAKLKEYKEVNENQAVEIRKIIRNFSKLKQLTKEKLIRLNQISVEEDEESDTSSFEKTSYEDNATFKIDGKVTISEKLRNFFTFIPDAFINKDGEVEDKVGYVADIVETVPFDVVYNTLTALLSGQRADYKGMIAHLENYIDAHPWLQNVIEKLEEADESIKTDFVVAMSKHYVSMKFIMWERLPDGKYSLVVFDANANAIGRQIEEDWYDNFTNGNATIAAPDDPADLIINPTVITKLTKQFETWFDGDPRKTSYGIVSEDKIKQMKKEGQQWLAELGITLSNKAWGEIAAYKRRKFTGLFRNAGGVFRILYENLKDREAAANSGRAIPLSLNNPFASSAFSKLALLEAKYTRHILSNSHRAGDSTVYSHTLNKYAAKRIRDLKEDTILTDKLLQISFSKNSLWLDNIKKDQEERQRGLEEDEEVNTPWLNNFNLHYMSLESIKQKYNIESGPEMKQTDSAEQEVIKLGLFQNKGNDIGYFFYPTTSDKTSVMMVEAPKVKVDLDAKDGIANSTIDLLYSQLVLPEINRILYFQEGKSVNDIGFENGWHIFYMIPELNNLEVIYNEDGTLRADVLEDKSLVSAIKDIVRTHVENLVNQKLDEWSDLGIGKYNLKQDDFQVASFLDHVYMSGKSMHPLAKTKDDKVRFAATDFVINYLITNANLYQIVIGDPALFFKSSVKKAVISRIQNDATTKLLMSGKETEQFFFRNYMNDQERIQVTEDTFLNVGKRLAGDMAPGYDLYNEENNSFKQLFLKDASIESEAVEFFERLELAAAKDYRKIDSTDAQEFTTLSEHLYVMRHSGKMNAELYSKVIPIISKEIADGNFYYMDKIQASLNEKDWKAFKKVVYQPMKPVYVNNIADVENNIDRRIYIKSSSFPLSPDLVSGTQLDALRILMEKNAIDRAAFHTAAKVGAPSVMPTIVDAGVKGINEQLINDLDSDKVRLAKAVRVLPRTGFRIQQEIPYDPDKKEINVGTQERKLLFNNILNVNGFVFNKQHYNGKKLLHEYNSRYSELFRIAKENLIYELGGTTVDLFKLRKMLVEEAIKRDYPINDIYALNIDEQTGQFSLPLWASGSADRIQALLNSIVDNRVRKMKFPGKSLVLGTQEGFKVKTDVDLTNSGITFVEDFIPEEGLKPMRVEDGKFMPGQVILPFKFLNNKDKALDISNFIIEKDGKRLIDTTKFDKELLKVFGFRIPTQGHNSMAYLEIVGFLPKSAGDLIIAPRELTKQMGSDFDVDKLYLYMHHTEFIEYDEDTMNAIDDIQTEISALIKDNPEVFVPKDKNSTYYEIIEEENYLRKIIKGIKTSGKFNVGAFVENKTGEETFIAGSVNAKKHLPHAGIDAGDRLVHSFRAAFTDIVGNRQFNNPDQVDFQKLKLYARNLMDHDTAKLQRIDQSTFDDKLIEGKEKLSEWITDPVEIIYAKALKRIIIKYNQSYKAQINALYEAINKLEQLKKPMEEALEIKHELSQKLRDLKKNKSIYIRKVKKDNVDPFKLISAFKQENGLPKLDETFIEFIKTKGTAEAKDIALFELTELQDKVSGKEAFNELKKIRRRVIAFFNNYEKNLQNDIIDIHFSVLSNTNDKVQRQIHAPLAYGDLKGGKDLAAKINNARRERLQKEEIFSPLSDSYQKHKFINAMAGRVGGVGVFSLDSVLNTMFQQGQAINRGLIYAKTEPSFSAPPFRVMFGNKLSRGSLSTPTVIGNDDRYKSDVIAAYQSAAVDNEKEQIMDKINVNNYTYDVIRILNQLGFEEDIVAPFISQDIIFDYVQELVSARNSLQEYNPAAKLIAQNKVFTKYGKTIGENFKNISQKEREEKINSFLDKSDVITGDDMMNYIKLGKAHPDYYMGQLALLAKFLYLEDYGAALKRIQSAINTDSAGIGKSLHSAAAKMESVFDLHKGLIAGGEQTLGQYNLNKDGSLASITFNTINGFATEHALLLNNALWNDLFPFTRDAVVTVMDEILEITEKKGLAYQAKVDMYERIWKEIKSYIFANPVTLNLSTESASNERQRLLFDVIDDNNNIVRASLARILEAVKTTDYAKSNPFLNRLKPRIGKGTLPSSINFNAATAENYDELNLYTSFMEMLVHPVVLGEFNGKTLTSQDLARELILYSFITGGIQETQQFVKYIPVEYLQKTGFADKIKELNFNDPSIFGATILKTNPYDFSIFAQQFVQHNPGQIKRGEVGHFSQVDENGETSPIKDFKSVDVIEIEADKEIELADGEKKQLNGHFQEYLVERGTDKSLWLTEFVSFYDETIPQKYHLFKYVGGNRYERIPVLGTRFVGKKYVGKIKEYAVDNWETPSTINNFTLLKDAKKPKAKAIVTKDVQKPAVIRALTPDIKPVVNPIIDGMDMVTGGKPVIKDVLTNIIELTTNVGYREYAEQLLEIIDKTDISWNLELLNDNDRAFVGKIIHTNLGVKGYAVNIQINQAKVTDRNLLEETVLHELTHAFTTDLIKKYKESPSLLTAQQKNIIARLETLQKTYRKTITDEYGLYENEDLKAFVKAHAKDYDKDTIAQIYAAHNLQEFFALSMTSPEFQSRLNDKNLFVKFIDLITELLKAIGISINDDITKAVVRDITTLIKSRVETVVTSDQIIAPSIPARYSTKEKPIHIYVDGSDIKGTGKIGYGIHTKYKDKTYNTSGHYNLNKGGLEVLKKELGIDIDNHPSNGVMELYGSLVAIQNTPKEEFISIHQDLESVQLWILSRLIMRLTDNMHLSEDAYKKTFWKNLSLEEKQKIHNLVKEFITLDPILLEKKVYGDEQLSKGNFTKDKTIRTIADKIIDEILQRKGKVSYSWVRGHSGVEGNEAVDSVAKDESVYNDLPKLFNETVVNVTTLKTINIYSGDKNGFERLSNFLNGPIVEKIAFGNEVKEVKFKTVEHLYQFYKAYFAKDLEAAKRIIIAPTGLEAQKEGKKIKGLDKQTWDSISSRKLEVSMRAAFEQNPDAVKLLLSTGNAILTHKTSFSLGKWETEFPRILMKLREEFKGQYQQEIELTNDALIGTEQPENEMIASLLKEGIISKKCN